jgi:signal transduction histidine kinase
VLAEERRQQISVQAAEGLSVSADRLVLREAVTNVIDNAIKYSPVETSIVVTVRTDGAGRDRGVRSKTGRRRTASGADFRSFLPG